MLSAPEYVWFIQGTRLTDIIPEPRALVNREPRIGLPSPFNLCSMETKGYTFGSRRFASLSRLADATGNFSKWHAATFLIGLFIQDVRNPETMRVFKLRAQCWLECGTRIKGQNIVKRISKHLSTNVCLELCIIETGVVWKWFISVE